jgi:2-polyprenyl-3-methyl-5-hydroxy-6-metoxy-1,4-benzoquinol methylase
MNQNLTSECAFGGAQAYRAKSFEYFEGARYDYIDELPVNRGARILEVGCGYGGTGSLALAREKCGTYCGVELCLSAAEEAKGRLSEVLVGNIEEVQLPWPTGSFDVLILSEVLEHLVDPWTTLRKIRPLMKTGSHIRASSPNVSHYKLVKMLLKGDWTLTDVGTMDKTHLRWFTPKTYRDLFESSGYIVDSVRPLEPLGKKARLANTLTFARFEHLFIRQVDLRAHCE